MLNPQIKIKKMDELLLWREQLRNEKKKLVVTNGCFDILHCGHVEYLFKARGQGDALLVVLNSDDSVRELKGPDRPVNPEDARAVLLASLYFVDSVYVFNAPRCTEVLRDVTPDIYVKGADYNIDTINAEEKAALIEIGAEVRFIDLTPGFSTTAIIAKMKA